jgi:hypothetical protein
MDGSSGGRRGAGEAGAGPDLEAGAPGGAKAKGGRIDRAGGSSRGSSPDTRRPRDDRRHRHEPGDQRRPPARQERSRSPGHGYRRDAGPDLRPARHRRPAIHLDTLTHPTRPPLRRTRSDRRRRGPTRIGRIGRRRQHQDGPHTAKRSCRPQTVTKVVALGPRQGLVLLTHSTEAARPSEVSLTPITSRSIKSPASLTARAAGSTPITIPPPVVNASSLMSQVASPGLG